MTSRFRSKKADTPRVDVVLVRVVFVALTIMTSGFGGLFAYLIMVLVIPYAPTSMHRAVTAGIVVAILAGICIVLGALSWLLPVYGVRFPVGVPELVVILVVLGVLSIGTIASRQRRAQADARKTP